MSHSVSKRPISLAEAAIIEAFAAELPDIAKPLALIVRFEVQEGDGEAVEIAFERAKAPTLMEAGCLAFELNREARDPRQFVVFERWRNLADLEAHLRAEYISRLRIKLNELIAGAPEFHVLVPAV